MTVAFERAHSTVIGATPAQVLDYVSNPNSWPEWIAASHEITADDRPLVTGDTFHERWEIRSGEVELNWSVTDHAPGRHWIAEADTAFIGKIVCRYDVEPVDGGTKYTRTIRNPARAKPPTDEQVRRMDEEAETCLANIKRNVEARAGR
ncbi:MAG: SRPBCC family protein [Alphaproteobacteria bacterium]